MASFSFKATCDPRRIAWNFDRVGQAAKAAMAESPLEFPLVGAVEVSLVLVVGRPSRHYRTGARAGTVKETAPALPARPHDVLAFARHAAAAIRSAGVWSGSGQVAAVRVAKRYPLPGLEAEQPGLLVEVTAA